MKHGRASSESALDVSQSIQRAPCTDGRIRCATHKNVLWLRKRFKRIEPIELLLCRCVLRNIFAELAADLSAAELLSLAGNAFNTNPAMALQIAAMVSFGPPGVHDVDRA